MEAHRRAVQRAAARYLLLHRRHAQLDLFDPRRCAGPLWFDRRRRRRPDRRQGRCSSSILPAPRIFQAAVAGSPARPALLLGPGGEFAFVVLAVRRSPRGARSTRSARHRRSPIASLSMALISAARASRRRRIGKRLRARRSAPIRVMAVAAARTRSGRAIVVGYGRRRHGSSATAAWPRIGISLSSPSTPIARVWSRAGATESRTSTRAMPPASTFLARCGLAEALGAGRHDRPAEARSRPSSWRRRACGPTSSSSPAPRDADHARTLYGTRRHRRRAGDDRGEPAALRRRPWPGSGVAAGPVIASIHEKRDDRMLCRRRPRRPGAALIRCGRRRSDVRRR